MDPNDMVRAWIYGLVGLFALYVLYKLVDYVWRMAYVECYGERCVFVTGCDMGFGFELAKRLDSLGCHVFAGCLTERGETELKKTCSQRLRIVSLDVSKQGSVRNAYKHISRKLPAQGLWALVNNAGVSSVFGPPEWIPIDNYRTVFDVNVFGFIDVTMTFLPLIKRSHGRVVNMISVGGRITAVGAAPYFMSKYATESFSDTLRRSLRPFGCKLSVVEPGFHKTNMNSTETFKKGLMDAWNQSSKETKDEYGEDYMNYVSTEFFSQFERMMSSRLSDVVDAYEHALFSRRPRVRYVVGADAKYFWLPVCTWLPENVGDRILELVTSGLPLPAAVRPSVY